MGGGRGPAGSSPRVFCGCGVRSTRQSVLVERARDVIASSIGEVCFDARGATVGSVMC